jgi:TPR repeat protein
MAKKIEIMRAGGMRSDDPATALYLKAIEKHPGTLAVRSQYIVAAAPRWGGSTERLAHVVEHSKKLPEGERRYIAAQVDHEVGMMHLHMRKDGKSASQAFERAMAECPGFSESAAQVMGIYSEQHDYPRLIAASTHYINRKPGHGWGYRVRGWAYGNSGKLPESFKDYQRATQLGDTESYLILASFYENAVGGVKQDFQKALDLYQIAQEKGVPGAQEKAQRLRKIANIK